MNKQLTVKYVFSRSFQDPNFWTTVL